MGVAAVGLFTGMALGFAGYFAGFGPFPSGPRPRASR